MKPRSRRGAHLLLDCQPRHLLRLRGPLRLLHLCRLRLRRLCRLRLLLARRRRARRLERCLLLECLLCLLLRRHLVVSCCARESLWLESIILSILHPGLDALPDPRHALGLGLGRALSPRLDRLGSLLGNARLALHNLGLECGDPLLERRRVLLLLPLHLRHCARLGLLLLGCRLRRRGLGLDLVVQQQLRLG